MKRYTVTTAIMVEVEANNEDEAIEIFRQKIKKLEFDYFGEPEICEVI